MTITKLNLGSGYQKKEGFLNIDISPTCEPELCLDLARSVWPWPENSVSEVVADFSLEQMGENISHLEHVFKELHRVCANEAKIFIRGFHPRHDQFLLNPLCVHRLSPEFFHLLSVSQNLQQIASGAHDDCFGLKWSIDFEVTRFKFLISPVFQKAIESGSLSEQELRERMMFQNNVCQAYEVDLKVLKSKP